MPEMPNHIKDLAERSTQGWDEMKQLSIKALLIEYADIFAQDVYDLGKTHLAEHVIETGDAKPVAQPPRRVPLAFAEAEKMEIEKMLKQGIIRPSTSPWAAPILMVRK